MLNEKALKAYLKKKFRNVSRINIKKLGHGVHGSGFLVEIKTKKDTKSYVVKTLMPENFGHDYPSDRAGIFLLDLDEFKNLPKHVSAIDVLAELKNAHAKKMKHAGINVFTGKVMDAWRQGEIEPLKIKTQAISSATEVAIMILRIDDVILGGSESVVKRQSGPEM